MIRVKVFDFDCILEVKNCIIGVKCAHGKASMVNLTDSFILDSIYFTLLF